MLLLFGENTAAATTAATEARTARSKASKGGYRCVRKLRSGAAEAYPHRYDLYWYVRSGMLYDGTCGTLTAVDNRL